jgi:tRNA (cmo5U34)-methyltransferase
MPNEPSPASAAVQEDGALQFMRAFRDPEAVARYTDGPRRFVPGLEALHAMTAILLAEHAPADARVLVLGAGGGLEMRALAQAQPGWRFVGVDPAGPMLDLAARTLGEDAHRAQLIEGYIDDAPEGPFDAAVCLLTLHFLDFDERVRTLGQIHRRLRAGAPFVAAHGSFPQAGEDKARWLSRYAAYAVANGVEPQMAENARAAVATAVNMLAPDRDEAALVAGGFGEVELFFAAFTWRGWVARA